MDHVFSKDADDVRMLMKKANNNDLSIRHTLGKGENNIMSVGGFDDCLNINSSGRLVCNYDFLMRQLSFQRLEKNGLCASTSNLLFSGVKVITPGPRFPVMLLHRERNKNWLKRFLQTIFLQLLVVCYQLELCDVIKGASYLCCCRSCTFSKAINAYEFERHAGCNSAKQSTQIIIFTSTMVNWQDNLWCCARAEKHCLECVV
uniref:uncharacterized protein LOC122580895 n=1 Tax=Erigeron canadensis TaxID=72917 RepID=UPI001CB8D6BA|nr:uncharacterized protein LOC122580895 [Erigeron canadensis]